MVKVGIMFPFQLLSILRKEKINIVHSSLRAMAGPIMLISFLGGIKKRVVHYRSSDGGLNPTLTMTIFRRVSKLLVRLFATDIIAVSNHSMQFHMGKNATRDPRCRVVYNGIQTLQRDRHKCKKGLHKEFDIPVESKVVIHVGNFRWQKNHGFIIKILKSHDFAQCDLRLILAGRYDGTDEEIEIKSALDKIVREEGLSDKVIFAGLRDDIPNMLMGSDCLLFPSISEGLPGAVLESLSHGTPVLCSDSGPFKEIAASTTGVTHHSLEAPYSTWASALSVILNGDLAKNNQSRTATADSFAVSPFTIARHCAALKEIYNYTEHESDGIHIPKDGGYQQHAA